MKSNYFLNVLAFLSIFSCLTSCGGSGKASQLFGAKEATEFTYSEADEEGYKRIGESAQMFSAKVSDKLLKTYQNGENLAFSPISIYLDLGMAVEMTRGNTQKELLSALNIDYNTLRNNYSSLYRSLNNEFEGGMSIATNSIWLDCNLSFKEDTLENLANKYYCYSYSTDFMFDNENANKAITNFIKEHTNEFLAPDLNLSELTSFVLLNTFYLKDVWNVFGKDLATYKEKVNFKNSDESITNKEFLCADYEFGLSYETDDFDTFYAQTENSYKLIFIKPKEKKTVKDVFTEENIYSLLKESFNDNAVDEENNIHHFTRVIFPEFEASFDENIKDLMVDAFNVKDLFSSSCDISPLFGSNNSSTSCSALQHITKLKVDSLGIEGAAVTALVGDTSIDVPYQKVFHDFVIDRDFGYLILDKYDNLLFSGVVEKI